MADEQINQSLFTWIISTITSGLFAGLAWLGIHTKRLNELNTKIEVSAERELNRDAKITEIQTTIKEIQTERKSDMERIIERWDNQINANQKLTAVLIKQTDALSGHDTRLDLLEKKTNFKVSKK